MLFLIVAYYIGLGVGTSLIIFISYLFNQKKQIEQKKNLIVQENRKDFLIRCKKVQDLYTFYTS